MDLIEAPDPRIPADEIGTVVLAQWSSGAHTTIVTHQKAGCPKIAPIELVHASKSKGYMRCSKCLNSLTPEACYHVWHEIDANYDKKTNTFKV
jgi:hypothetical protein